MWLIWLAAVSTASAADWLSIQGAEPADPAKAEPRVLAFVQVAAEVYAARPVEGLTSQALAPHNGEVASFNMAAGTSRSFALSLRRVRLGGRGAIPKTNGLASGFFAVELGQNALTSAAQRWSPRRMDASITLHGPADVHLRLGQFKLPLGDESLEAVHLTGDLVRVSMVTGRLLMERDATSGAYTGPVNGFRDVGAELFGSHKDGKVEVSWAVMASNGTTDLARDEPGVDGTARLQVARLFSDPRRDAQRDELSAWVFATTGQRRVAQTVARRSRAGVGAQLQREGVRLRTELVVANGVLNTGAAPPFLGGHLTVDATGEAWGITGLATVRVDERWEFGLSCSHLDSLPGRSTQRRVFDSVVAVGQLHVARSLWFDLNVGARDGRAPGGGADAEAVLSTMGPFAAVMLTASL